MDNKKDKALIIAEIGQAHDGSLGIAHSYIDAVSKVNVDAVKFQTHIAHAETTIHEPWRVKFSKQDKTRYDYWKRMEISKEGWKDLKKHAHDVGLKFLSSPFSLEAVELLKEVGVDAWKIASGEVNNDEILDSIAETKLEIYLSTGMSSVKEIDSSVKKIKDKDIDFTLMQCTSMYPTPSSKVGLNIIDFFKDRYKCSVGLSDHSGQIYPGLAATTMGIDVLEVHATFSKEIFGPDTSSSLSIEDLKRLVEGVRFIEDIKRNYIDKDVIALEFENMRRIFRKSIVYKTDLKKGAIITINNILYKKPGTGIDPKYIKDIIGKKLKKDVKEDELIVMDNLQ
jgi:N,N'-diacetyllegionaminate synthase